LVGLLHDRVISEETFKKLSLEIDAKELDLYELMFKVSSSLKTEPPQ
jgi:hypothetical protein